jgi:hypothetical protein
MLPFEPVAVGAVPLVARLVVLLILVDRFVLVIRARPRGRLKFVLAVLKRIPADRAERLTLRLVDFRRVGASAPLEIKMVSNCVV